MAGTEARSWQRTTLMIASLPPSTHCSTLSDVTMPLPPVHSVYNGSMIQTPRRRLCAAAMRTKAKQPSPSPACAAPWRRQRCTEAYGTGRDTPHIIHTKRPMGPAIRCGLGPLPGRSATMPTEREKQAEKDRVTKIGGVRVGYHDLLAEIDLPALKARNDRWEAEHQPMTREERKQDELYRMVAYIGGGKAAGHIAIHIHAAHQCGATPEEIYQLMKKVAPWSSGPESYHLILKFFQVDITGM